MVVKRNLRNQNVMKRNGDLEKGKKHSSGYKKDEKDNNSLKSPIEDRNELNHKKGNKSVDAPASKNTRRVPVKNIEQSSESNCSTTKLKEISPNVESKTVALVAKRRENTKHEERQKDFESIHRCKSKRLAEKENICRIIAKKDIGKQSSIPGSKLTELKKSISNTENKASVISKTLSVRKRKASTKNKTQTDVKRNQDSQSNGLFEKENLGKRKKRGQKCDLNTELNGSNSNKESKTLVTVKIPKKSSKNEMQKYAKSNKENDPYELASKENLRKQNVKGKNDKQSTVSNIGSKISVNSTVDTQKKPQKNKLQKCIASNHGTKPNGKIEYYMISNNHSKKCIYHENVTVKEKDPLTKSNVKQIANIPVWKKFNSTNANHLEKLNTKDVYDFSCGETVMATENESKKKKICVKKRVNTNVIRNKGFPRSKKKNKPKRKCLPNNSLNFGVKKVILETDIVSDVDNKKLPFNDINENSIPVNQNTNDTTFNDHNNYGIHNETVTTTELNPLSFEPKHLRKKYIDDLASELEESFNIFKTSTPDAIHSKTGREITKTGILNHLDVSNITAVDKNCLNLTTTSSDFLHEKNVKIGNLPTANKDCLNACTAAHYITLYEGNANTPDTAERPIDKNCLNVSKAVPSNFSCEEVTETHDEVIVNENSLNDSVVSPNDGLGENLLSTSQLASNELHNAAVSSLGMKKLKRNMNDITLYESPSKKEKKKRVKSKKKLTQTNLFGEIFTTPPRELNLEDSVIKPKKIYTPDNFKSHLIQTKRTAGVPCQVGKKSKVDCIIEKMSKHFEELMDTELCVE